MLQRALIFSCLLVLGVLAFSIQKYGVLKPRDWEEYNQSKEQQIPRVLQRQPAVQKREGVRKDLWSPKNGSRSRFSMESETSKLILIDRNGKIEATELLENAKGEWMEKDFVRCFAAQEGAYFYPSHRFIGSLVEFGFSENGSPSFRGTAEKMDISLIAKSPCLSAEGVDLFSGESLRISGSRANYDTHLGLLEMSPSCRLEMGDARLECEGPLTLFLEEQIAQTELPFHYRDNAFRIDANAGKLLYTQEEGRKMFPQTVQCKGNVRLFSEENYALADEMVYFPETKSLHLFAKSANRVLFWKSDGSIQISAPEVAAHLGDREEIRGVGDVHFTFDLEEEHRIETLFGKYLQ